MKLFAVVLSILFAPLFSLGQAQIVNGPMLGYCEIREVMVWVQLDSEADIHLEFFDLMSPKDITKTEEVHTSSEKSFTAHLCCQLLKPGTTYGYHIIVDQEKRETLENCQFSTQELWQYRKAPPAFSVAVGSCTYINDREYDRPGKPYGGHYEIFESIASKQPNMMLWLGDNTYFRDADLASESTMNYRYSHTRNIEELQGLLASCHHYAIWDDHDFGPDNSNGSFIGKQAARNAFTNFWANKQYGEQNEAIYSKFSYNDVDFFLLDNRWHRTAKDFVGIEATILGQVQLEWFIQALQFSKAKFKIVCIGGQFLSDLQQYENYANYPEERELILSLINLNHIQGVVFLTGDRHSTELTKQQLDNENWVYDLTVSPLTSGSYDHSHEENTFVDPKSRVADRNFAVLDFSGPLKTRQLTMKVYNSLGELLWVRIIE
ncbi:MAG: alkaline phosphatase D [Flavobacteriales bacterium]|jgi:alkaline phosphatase D